MRQHLGGSPINHLAHLMPEEVTEPNCAIILDALSSLKALK